MSVQRNLVRLAETLNQPINLSPEQRARLEAHFKAAQSADLQLKPSLEIYPADDRDLRIAQLEQDVKRLKAQINGIFDILQRTK